MTTSQSLMTVNNQNYSNGTTSSTITVPEFKHCECKNSKELIQLIRSEAIESVQVSWPDDMGLWYSSVIKSCEVSLQNLVEGIKLSGQLLFVDPTSARYDLSKKEKTILVRCSLNNNNINNNSIATSSCSSNNSARSSSSSIFIINNSNGSNNNNNSSPLGDDSGDGEVCKSPPSKFSLLLDESEKSRNYISTNQTQTLNQNHPPSSTGSPPFLYVTSPPSSVLAAIINSNNNGPGGSGIQQQLQQQQLQHQQQIQQQLQQQQQQLLELLSSSTPSSTPTSPSSLKGSVLGGCGAGYQSLKKTQSIQPPKGYSSSSTILNLSTSYKDSVLGKRALEDPDSSWLEEIRNGSTVEIVPDLSNPLLPLCGSSNGLSVNASSSPLNSSDSSPGLPSNDDSSSENDLGNIDSTERAILEGQIHLPPLLRPRQYHACKIPKEDRPSKRRKNHTSLFCRHCGTKETPEWRRGPDGRKSLCNACGLHYSKLVKKENMAVPQLSRSFDITDLLNPSD